MGEMRSAGDGKAVNSISRPMREGQEKYEF